MRQNYLNSRLINQYKCHLTGKNTAVMTIRKISCPLLQVISSGRSHVSRNYGSTKESFVCWGPETFCHSLWKEPPRNPAPQPFTSKQPWLVSELHPHKTFKAKSYGKVAPNYHTHGSLDKNSVLLQLFSGTKFTEWKKVVLLN